jgi:hypothetical protein
LRKEQVNGGLILLALLLSAGTAAALIFKDSASSQLGVSTWVAVPLLTLATMALFIITLFLALVLIYFVRTSRLRSEGYVVALARHASGEKGDIERSGPLTIWWSGPSRPVPLLIEQMEVMRSRMQALIGAEIGGQHPLRILCFRSRSGFEAFLKPFATVLLTMLKTFDGIYLRRPYRVFTMCTEEVPYNVLDPETTARILFCYYYIFDHFPGGAAAFWLQRGISKTLTSNDDDRARLNRKMLASLSRGTMLASELFALNDKDLSKLFKCWSDHHCFARLEQISGESWSVCEYLCGKLAPEDRRNRFRGFLGDAQLSKHPEDAFKRHFEPDFGGLIEDWRGWVREQGTGSIGPLPAHIEAGLFKRVIPLIENRHGRHEDRILAIRNMGIHGYVVGADALIGLLRSDDAIPVEEVVWALEAISGMTYGENRDYWAAWWSSLPVEIRERRNGHGEN